MYIVCHRLICYVYKQYAHYSVFDKCKQILDKCKQILAIRYMKFNESTCVTIVHLRLINYVLFKYLKMHGYRQSRFNISQKEIV